VGVLVPLDSGELDCALVELSPTVTRQGRCYPSAMPGNIGWQGLVIILIVLLVIFGPKRLPEMGRSIGRGMREFKESVTGKDDDDQPREIPPADQDETVPGAPPRERDSVS
jgi:sec-independent protein translocase protein TatA